jgi:hypothetical protein
MKWQESSAYLTAVVALCSSKLQNGALFSWLVFSEVDSGARQAFQALHTKRRQMVLVKKPLAGSVDRKESVVQPEGHSTHFCSRREKRNIEKKVK